MRIQDHIRTLTWTAADKALFILYGFIHFFQIRQLLPDEYGLFAELIALHSFIFGISDGFALQGIIKFGADAQKRGSINKLALLWHTVISLGLPLIIFIFQKPLASLFEQPRFPVVADVLVLYSLVSLPRLYCIKFLSRDIRMKDTFIANALWFFPMIIMTFVFYYTHGIRSFEDMLIISFIGMAVSSIGTVVLAWKSIEMTTIDSVPFTDFFSFGGYQVSTLTIGNVMRQLDVFLIEYFFSTRIVGVYSSAKQLFRVFDQIFEAIAGLLYTGGVRLVHQKRDPELLTFISKATSFTFILMILAIIPLELGFAKILITALLSEKYVAAIGYFQIISLVALSLPFVILSLVLVAYGKLRLLLQYVTIASITGLVALIIISLLRLEFLIPIGLVTYNFVLGALCYRFAQTQLGLSPRMLLRAIPDTKQFIQQWWVKRRGNV